MDHAGLEFTGIHLPLPPKCWYLRYATVPGQFIFNSNFIFHDLYVSVVLKEAKRGY